MITNKKDTLLELPRIIAKLWTMSQLLMYLDVKGCGFGDNDKDLYGVACILEDMSDELVMIEDKLYPGKKAKGGAQP